MGRTKAEAPSGPAPSWHELVQPAAGVALVSEKRRAERAERKHTGTMTHEFHGPNRAQRRASGWMPNKGRLVQHRSRLHAVYSPFPRPDVLRRQLIRALRGQGVDVVDERQVA